jgi:hypothetical protein
MTPVRAFIAPVTVIAIALFAGSAGASGSATFNVSNAAGFARAVAKAHPGDTIALAPGYYGVLPVKRRRFVGSPLTIDGPRTARVDTLKIDQSSGVSVSGLSIVPTSPNHAWLSITGSSNVVVNDVLFDGVAEAWGSGLYTDGASSNITLEGSELTNCGEGARCVGPGASNLTIQGNNFHDCYDCDFIRGGGTNVTISNNTFDRAVPGSCVGGADYCHHNDLVQIMGGSHWTITDNHFGVRRVGAGQIWMKPTPGSPGIDDVYIANNLFDGGPMAYSVRVADVITPGLQPPTHVTIVNNTILSGTVSAVALSDLYASVPLQARPLVANNILSTLTPKNCGLGRFDSNLTQAGAACPHNDAGPANLDPSYIPTPLSVLVDGLADPTLAPALDGDGHPRGQHPDRGAFQGAS